MPIQGVILATMAQFTYTTLFGAYVSYIYIKSGSLLAIALVHSFCNFMGLPNVYPFLIWNNVGSKKIQNTITMCKVLSAGVYLVGIYSFFILFDESTGLFKDGKQWW
jgi:membrane protease YdiL (CAAX protease family)